MRLAFDTFRMLKLNSVEIQTGCATGVKSSKAVVRVVKMIFALSLVSSVGVQAMIAEILICVSNAYSGPFTTRRLKVILVLAISDTLVSLVLLCLRTTVKICQKFSKNYGMIPSSK